MQRLWILVPVLGYPLCAAGLWWLTLSLYTWGLWYIAAPVGLVAVAATLTVIVGLYALVETESDEETGVSVKPVSAGLLGKIDKKIKKS